MKCKGTSLGGFPPLRPSQDCQLHIRQDEKSLQKEDKIKQPFITLGKTKETKQLFFLYEFVYIFHFHFFLVGRKKGKEK